MIRPVLAIAGSTFTEVLRQPAFLIVVLFTLAATLFSPWLAMFSLGEEVSLLKDFGLSTLLVSALVLACLAASGVVRREIELRTTLTLLAKPVSREVFLLAKFLGVAAALALALCLSTLELLLAARQAAAPTGGPDWPALAGGLGACALALLGAALANYLWGKSFCSATLYLAAIALSGGFVLVALFGPGWSPAAGGRLLDPLLVAGAVLAFLGGTVLAAFAVAVSVWLGRGGTLGVTGGLLAAGLALPSLEGGWRAALVLVPDFQCFWVGELFYQGQRTLPAAYLLECALYAAAHATAFLALGALGLRRKAL